MFDNDRRGLRRRRRSHPTSGAGARSADPSPSSSSLGQRHRHRRLRTPTPSSLRRLKIAPRQAVRPLARASSEPILFAVRLLGSPSGQRDGRDLPSPSPSLYLPRPHTCSDVLLPSLPPLGAVGDQFNEGAKVVVSVTVEGSPGPVKAMVRLGASVEEAIGVIVEQYDREGRTPRIEKADAADFELHHSHFSLQSLGKCEKIGQVGGRSFYLRTSSGRSEGTNLTTGSSEMSLVKDNPLPVPFDFFIAFITAKMQKIGRRTKKIWRVVTCITCS